MMITAQMGVHWLRRSAKRRACQPPEDQESLPAAADRDGAGDIGRPGLDLREGNG